MNSSYGPLVLVVVTIGLAVYAATSSGPDGDSAHQGSGQGSQPGTEQAAAPSAGQDAPKTAAQAASQGAGQGTAETDAQAAGQSAAQPGGESGGDMVVEGTAAQPGVSQSAEGTQGGSTAVSKQGTNQGAPAYSRYPGPLPPGEGLAQGQESRPFKQDSGRSTETASASGKTASSGEPMSMSTAMEQSMGNDPSKVQASGQPSQDASSQASGSQAAGSQAAGSQAAASQTGNDQEGTVQAVWEEVKEAGRETADIFTGDDSGQQSANDGQGPLADIWEELKEAGHQTAQIFVGNEGSNRAGAQGGGSQAQQSGGASASQGSGQGESGQRDVKVYTTQGQELGAISAIVIDRANNDVRAIVIGQADAGSSNRVDQKLRDALCGDRAQ